MDIVGKWKSLLKDSSIFIDVFYGKGYNKA